MEGENMSTLTSYSMIRPCCRQIIEINNEDIIRDLNNDDEVHPVYCKNCDLFLTVKKSYRDMSKYPLNSKIIIDLTLELMNEDSQKDTDAPLSEKTVTKQDDESVKDYRESFPNG